MTTRKGKNRNPLMNSQSRASILAIVAHERDGISFPALASRMTELTEGDLSLYVQKLETAGWIATEKHAVDGRPDLIICCTDKGRRELKADLKWRNDQLRYLSEGAPDERL